MLSSLIFHLLTYNSNGVKGFPTIKHGDPTALEDYKSGRDYNSFATFASELKPACSPANIDLCGDEEKAEIEAIQAMSTEDLTAKVAEGEAKIEAAEEEFKSKVEELQKTYQELQVTKDDAIEAVKKDGLGLMKAVLALKEADGGEAKEL